MTDDILLGATLDDARYRIVQRMFGAPERGVYRGVEVATGTRVRITVGTPQHDLDAARHALGYTAPKLATLRHAGPVMGYHGIVEDEPPGEPLTDLAIDRATAKWIVAETARTVRRANDQGIVLAGLRPEAIYTWGTLPQVTGIAPRAEPFLQGARSPSIGVASPFPFLYVAPEILRRPFDPPTPAADAFSLFAILAHALGGMHPFEGESNAQIIAIAAGRRRPWRGSEDDGTTLALGLADDPADRHDLDTLIDWLTGDPE